MNIQSIKMACFSPTGTSKAVAKAVARGIGGDAELIDLTRPDIRKQKLKTGADELLVVAVPVYIGRVPAAINEWLNSIEAGNTPTVCITVYGNRAFEDALLELKDILKERGCVPIAGAAFIGEHSFSCDDTPIAVSRPDAADIARAEEFGKKVAQAIGSIADIAQAADIDFPGNRPYRNDVMPAIEFIEVSDDCIQCGVCAETCPMEAIDPDNSRTTDTAKCIYCCACIKACPEHARAMMPGMLKDISKNLVEMCKERKEPEFFF